MIERRNAYLGQDMLEEAITRKNERCKELHEPSMVLTPADFRAEKLSEDVLQERREDVDEKINAAVGWEGPEGPKTFFKRARMLMDDADNAEQVSWHLAIAGAKGVGKTKCAALAAKFMRGYGVVSSDEVQICQVRWPPTEPMRAQCGCSCGSRFESFTGTSRD